MQVCKQLQSTAYLYHEYGITTYEYIRTEYEKGKTIFYVRPKKTHIYCRKCQSRSYNKRGTNIRRVHAGVNGNRKTEIVKTYLKKTYSRPDVRHLKVIAIDETSVSKGHRYFTIVYDLIGKRVVWVGEGKGQDALAGFWKRIGRAKNNIEYVAMDMGRAYPAALKANLPHAQIVFDHFHVFKLITDKLSKFRTQLANSAIDSKSRGIIKGARWLLLKNAENLDPARNEQERLRDALELNQPLATAYYMKEELGLLWKQPDKDHARGFLGDWIAKARASGIRMLAEIADTLGRLTEEILAYYDGFFSTGPLEGINNKIKTLKRQAYGYRDKEFFKLRIYAIHHSKYSFTG